MSYKDKFYLVRHGSYIFGEGLDDMGREVHAPEATRQLIDRGLGATSIVLLSSDARRAAETADIIGEGLGVSPVYSGVINNAGNHARIVENLDAVVAEALEKLGVVIDDEHQGLVVVTHAPMLAVARKVDVEDIEYGEVFEYLRNSWDNPYARRQLS